MSRHRPPRRRRADHRPLRPIEPPKLVAVLLEVLGHCWECGAPLEHTPSGLCSLKHQPDCRLLAQVEAMT
jgi:hypothetical protein